MTPTEIILAISTLAAIVTGLLAHYRQGKSDVVQQELVRVQVADQLVDTSNELLEKVKAMANDMEEQLIRTRVELDETKAKLRETRKDLRTTQDELKDTSELLQATREELLGQRKIQERQANVIRGMEDRIAVLERENKELTNGSLALIAQIRQLGEAPVWDVKRK